METYCPYCDAVTAAKVEMIRETYNVRGEEITISANVAICQRCKEQIFDEELDSGNLEKVYAEFRNRTGTLTPGKIRAIRKKYGLSQRALGRLLKLGDITIHRYENGSLPSDAHNELLILIEEPSNVKMLLDQVGSNLTAKEEEKLRERLRGLLSAEVQKIYLDSTERLLDDYEASQFSGFRTFSPEKIQDMAVYIAESANNLSKTKLLKLFFYSDFYHFKNNGISISGLRYAHLPHGPVANNYNTLITWLDWQKTIKLTPTNTETQWELISPNRKLGDVLEPDELNSLKYVTQRLGNLSARQLSNLSHQEKGYTETTNGQLISYEYALELNL